MRKIIMASITAVVVIAVLAGTLIPVLDDATTTEETFTNDGLWRMTEFTNGLQWDYDAAGTWELNDVEQITGTSSMSGNNAVLGSDWIIRANGYIRGADFTLTPSSSIVVITNDGVSITSGSYSYTAAMEGYGVDINGDSLLTESGNPVYIKGDSLIYATGQSNIGSGRGIIHFEGTIDDGITGSAYAISGDSYTDFSITNIQVDKSAVDGFEDLYVLNNITADVSCIDSSDNTLSGTVTYDSYVVPYEVTAERSVHFTDGENAILNAIPVIVIVALLLAVVAMVLRSRMD